MQREKLYNFHRATYFIAALFVFKIDKVLRNQILGIEDIDRIELSFFWKQLQ